jgi:threonylcarbamoyladenosine tRNA methylthiotransferase MtaB
MPSLKTITLGCKVNQYETEYVRQGLLGAGYRDASDDEPADLCIVNTCTVTHEGDAKSRQSIRQLAKRNPGTRIVVMGCYATRAPGEVADLPNVTEVVRDKRELADLVLRLGGGEPPEGISDFRGHHRAFVKVQDGCLLRCSFCVIPLVRPVLTSRPVEHILREARRLAQAGFREIVLTGIHLGHYGVEQNRGRPRSQWLRLAQLVEQLARLGEECDFRVRLSSIEATEVTRQLLQVMAAHPRRVCPHLHISLQSGSEAVLRRMRRRWGAKRFVGRCRLAQQILDEPALTTDIIVGFPGETEADFQATCELAEEVGFSKIHVFSYSRRRGTPAADMPDQVSEPVKQERRRRLLDLEQSLRARYAERLRGRKLEVLVEGVLPDRPGRVLGTACRYLPVELPGDESMVGQFVRQQAG